MSELYSLGRAAQTAGAQPPVSLLWQRDANSFASACPNVTLVNLLD